MNSDEIYDVRLRSSTCGPYSRVLRLEMPSRNRGSGPGTHLGQHLSGLSRRLLTGNRISLKRNSDIRSPGLGPLASKKKERDPSGSQGPSKTKERDLFLSQTPFYQVYAFSSASSSISRARVFSWSRPQVLAIEIGPLRIISTRWVWVD